MAVNKEKLFPITFVRTLNIEFTISDNKLSTQLGQLTSGYIRLIHNPVNLSPGFLFPAHFY